MRNDGGDMGRRLTQVRVRVSVRVRVRVNLWLERVSIWSRGLTFGSRGLTFGSSSILGETSLDSNVVLGSSLDSSLVRA